MKFSLLPSGNTDKVEIVLNWGAKASNLDLHTMQINKENPGAGCETFFNKMVGCEKTTLDGDMFSPNTAGGELVTISSPQENLKYTYMIFVKDNSADEDELEWSEAHIDISDGKKSLSRTLPTYTRNTLSGASYWFVGCLRTVGDSFEFAPVDALSRDNPYRTEKFYCDNLYKTNADAGKEVKDQFCDDISLQVRFQTEQYLASSSFLSGCGERCSTVQVISVGKTEQKTIYEGQMDRDSVRVPITSNGQYLVRVEGDDYVSAEDTFAVTCDITDCRACKPSYVLPISPTLRPDQARIMLSWAKEPNTLKLSSVETGCEEVDTDFIGDDITAVWNVESSVACSEKCKNTKGCSHWTWVGQKYLKNTKLWYKCHLKNGDSGRTKETGLISGRAGCIECG